MQVIALNRKVAEPKYRAPVGRDEDLLQYAQESAVAQVMNLATDPHGYVHRKSWFQNWARAVRDAGAIAFGFAAGTAALAAPGAKLETELHHLD